MVVGLIIGFLCGVIGFAILFAVMARRKLPGTPEFKPVINWKEIFKAAEPKTDSKAVAVGSIPRSNKGWRNKRMELQAQHNSKQKQRDSGLPSI